MNEVKVLLRISAELKSALESIAKEEHRSLNNLLTVILEKYIEERSNEGD